MRIIIVPHNWSQKRLDLCKEIFSDINEQTVFLVGNTMKDPYEMKVKKISEKKLIKILEEYKIESHS